MKKTFTLLIVAVVMVAFGCNSAFATDYYKKYFINENFDEIETWPTGWVVRTGNGDSPFGKNGGMAISNQMVAFSGNGTGSRGASLFIPSTKTAPFAYPADSVWCIEFDWTLQGELTNRNAMAILVSGSDAISANSADGWYTPGIFGLYAYRDGGFLHYMNLDRDGLPARDPSTGNLIAGQTNGQVITGGNGQSFTRADVDNTICDSLNAPSRTKVIVTNGNTYHITATIDLKVGSQQVLELTITDNADPDNTDTISTPLAFLAPTYVSTTVPPAAYDTPEKRIVTDIGIISMQNTRGSNAGNGNNANIGGGLDNLGIYVWQESLGKADVTINYVDRDGGVAKTARVASQQEVGLVYSLITSDKANFNDGANYYFYDANATHTANAAKGADGESLTVALQTGSTPNPDNALTVVFKKEPTTLGTYVWSGSANNTWNYLENNFNVAGGSAISYQPGNAVQFSRTDVENKAVSIDEIIELGDADMTVSAPDYTFTGAGRIVGNGALKIDAPATLIADNRLLGGAVISDAVDSVVIQSAVVAASLNLSAAAKTKMVMQPAATFSRPINGAGGTLNMYMVSPNECSSAITGFSTINISFADRGRETGNAWTNPFTSVIEAGTQVNIIDATNQDIIQYPATYAVNAGSIANAKVHLGDNTRIIFNGTPGGNATTSIKIGELSGVAGSMLQGNSVAAAYDRIVEYAIGGLNTDAVFNGDITPQLTREPARRSGTAQIWDRLTAVGDTVWFIPSTLKILKEGTGKWTVGGQIIIPDATSPSTVTVSDGTLVLLDSLIAPASNLITVTVDAAGTLQTSGNYIGASNVIVNGTVEGGAEYANSFSMIDPASVLKLNVNSFATGDYDVIKTYGDIAIKGGTIDITIANPPSESQQIVILESEGNYDIIDNMENVKVLVNGTDITDNTASMEIPGGAKGFYYFDPETGTLGAKGNLTGLQNIFVNKEIKSIEYYNLLGQKVYENSTGVILKIITYTDNSVQTEKIFNREKH